MSWDQILTGFVYLAIVLVLVVIGKWVYALLHRGFVLQTELVENDNAALALTIAGYYLGLAIVLGAVVSGPGSGVLTEDGIDLVVFGLMAIVLLNLSGWINDKIIFSKLDNQKEIIQDRNTGMGAIEGGNHVAVGLITAGALAGEGGLLSAAVFWILGEAGLIVAALLYEKMTSFDLHEQIENDNTAVGLAFAGVLIGFGNIIRLAGEGDFVSWTQSLSEFGYYAIMGLILLPLVRMFTDKVLLPGARLSDELVQDVPNVGAGAIEATMYLAASVLIGSTL